MERRADCTEEQVLAGWLPVEQRLEALPQPMCLLLDTLRMIAYRAETALANVVAPELGKPKAARALLRALFARRASPPPDYAAGTLTLQVLQLGSRT